MMHDIVVRHQKCHETRRFNVEFQSPADSHPPPACHRCSSDPRHAQPDRLRREFPSTSSTGSSSAEKVGVSLIVKTTSNPFFVSMQDGAKKAAETDGVDLKLAAGKADGDEETQIQAIENAISKGDKGILITPNGPSVVDALKKAKDAGLFVIALDTPPDPADAADITFATDNFAAGELIGKWTAAQLGGKKATIALLDLFDDKVVSVDYNRDQGFLTGLGIDTADKKKNGDEAKTGKYTGGKGGDYEIVGSQASQGAEDGGRTAMETLLAKNPNINVVYTINERLRPVPSRR